MRIVVSLSSQAMSRSVSQMVPLHSFTVSWQVSYWVVHFWAGSCRLPHTFAGDTKASRTFPPYVPVQDTLEEQLSPAQGHPTRAKEAAERSLAHMYSQMDRLRFVLGSECRGSLVVVWHGGGGA